MPLMHVLVHGIIKMLDAAVSLAKSSSGPDLSWLGYIAWQSSPGCLVCMLSKYQLYGEDALQPWTMHRMGYLIDPYSVMKCSGGCFQGHHVLERCIITEMCSYLVLGDGRAARFHSSQPWVTEGLSNVPAINSWLLIQSQPLPAACPSCLDPLIHTALKIPTCDLINPTFHNINPLLIPNRRPCWEFAQNKHTWSNYIWMTTAFYHPIDWLSGQ